MKKNSIIKTVMVAFIFAVCGMIANAQPLVGTKVSDNISLTIKGGATTPLQDPVNQDYVRGIFGLELQKQLTPIVGVGIEGEWTVNTSSWKGCIPSSYLIDHQYVGAFTTTNWMNLLAGYKGKPRVFEIETVLGVGWNHAYASVEGAEANTVMTKAGANLNFNLGESKAWTIGIKPAVVWNLNKNAFVSNYNVNRAALQLQVGVTYRFENSNDKHHFTYCDKVATQAEVDALNKKVNQLREALRVCQERPAEIEEVYVEKVIVKTEKVVTPTVIQFKAGSFAIPETSSATIKALALELMATGKKCTLNGYASVDGVEEQNKVLSEKRATAVKEALIERGVNPEQITVVANGSTDKFGDEKNINRVVISSID